MMNRFSNKIGAAVLLAAAALYAVIALVTGHSAAAEPPPDLAATDAGLDVWRAAALMLEHEDTCVADVRDPEHFELYHLPRAVAVAGGASAIGKQCGGEVPVLVVAPTDAAAAELVGQLRQDRGEAAAKRVHFLQDGVRAWYLTFALPVPLFTDKPAPFGYPAALEQLSGWLAAGTQPSQAEIDKTLGVLVRADYRPTALTSKRKAGGAKKRKKISGGCG